MSDERRRDERAGDPAVDAAWRAASRSEPPAHVDDVILAAARAEARAAAQVRKTPAQKAWWTTWQPLAAAAGVFGLAFALVQMLPREEAARVPAVESARAPTETAKSGDSAPAATSTAASAPAPAAAPAQAAAEQSVPARQEAARDMSAENVARPSAMAGAAPPAPAEAAAQESPDAWARRIAELHDAGDVAAAATELRAFREAYPDADGRLPESLRGWAASLPAADPP
jgi:hypothetical protein